MAVLTAIDGERGSDRVVERGYDLATAYDDEQVVALAVPESADTAEAEASANQVLDAVFGDDVPDRVRVRGGKYVHGRGPASKILTIAEEIDPRYIVIGSRKSSPAGKVVLGSVAQDVLLSTDAPVVIVGTK